MGERWFSDEELAGMAQPTMDRVVAAIDAGDLDAARALCEGMKHEWGMLHDLMVEAVLSLITFVSEKLGDEGVAQAWEYATEHGWHESHDAIRRLPRKALVPLLAATWRAHSTSGVGEKPGAFTIEEDDEKVTFSLHPCGSGQRLVQRGVYDRFDGAGFTKEAHDWSFGRDEMPLYCTHCAFMNESLPIRWSGEPLYPLDPPADYERDPCRWYWYKDAAAIPDRFRNRYDEHRREP